MALEILFTYVSHSVDGTFFIVLDEEMEDKVVKHILVLVAMEQEAEPLVYHLDHLPLIQSSFASSRHKIYSGPHNGFTVSIVTNGKDKNFGVDCVGTTPGAYQTEFYLS